MKNKTYILNTLLAVVLGVYLLAAVIVRTFCPQIILPKANIPNMVLISLIALVIEHYLVPDVKRCYICIPVFSALTFGLLPFAACFVGAGEALKLGVAGGIIAPAAVGFVAEHAGIQMGMGVVVGVTVMLLIMILVSTLSPSKEK